MAAKDIRFSTDARDRILRGVEVLNNAVKITRGPKGRNVVIEKSYGAPRISKDGVTVAKEIELSDKFENLGAQLLREVASKQHDNAGDGTTTAVVLASAIAHEGAKAVAAGLNPMDLKRGIELAVDAIVADLKKNSKKVTSNDEIAQIGTISANGDNFIGQEIAKAMQKVGNEGVITVEEAKSLETETEIVEGMQFDRGYLSPAIPALDTVKVENSDQKTGVAIVRKAIQTPARQIVDNSGGDGAVVVGKLLEAKEYSYGYDAQTGENGDLVTRGIIDPTKVVRTALQDAASIAGMMVTTEATVTEHPKKEIPALPPGGGMGNMDY